MNVDAIAEGLRRGEFFLEYMPTVSVEEKRCVGAEALIRWRRPSGLVRPAEFIPMADGTPVSGMITYWVIDTVAAELGDWLKATPEAHVSINVPPEILGRGGLDYAARKSGLHEVKDQIILEITERSVPDQLGMDALNRMARSGIRVMLDDVKLDGVNLAILARCPFQMIKLDPSLIAEVGKENPSPAWLTGLAALLRSTPLEVVAEGVETQEQLEILREAGIGLIQGHFFSEPLSAGALIEFHSVMNGRSA